MSSPKLRVMVGMSGGVDSSVAALLLKDQGYHVEGVFMKNWEEDDTDTYCSSSQDMADAQEICDKLNIELHRINFAAKYWESVFANFLSEYKAGRTPNPDILCNKEIKFKAFLDYAIQRGADFIATGHYVRRNAQSELLKALDKQKDQSYFLYALNKTQISQSIFPLGEIDKKEVRNIAKKAGFSNHQKKDSTGICFIGERKFKKFLNDYLPAKPGPIETVDGDEIGKHDGLMFYTLGQRQGLGIGGLKNFSEEPWYVADKDLSRNVLVVAQGESHPSLYKDKLIVKEMHWIGDEPVIENLSAKTRYRQSDQLCRLVKLDKGYEVQFEVPQKAITPGQSVVFYKEEVCLGGGVIEKPL